jgi:Zn-finger nucleic acid-binding protein
LFVKVKGLSRGVNILHNKKNSKTMKCPSCSETLLMSDKKGVEIDYCPNCRGIWLDRGELEKIIERSGEHYSKRENYDSDYKRYGYGEHGEGHGKRPTHKKKESFLSDLFDF